MEIIYKKQAEICKTLANGRRLKIIHILKKGEHGAGELLKKMDISKSNLSQHMSVLVKNSVVVSRRSGKRVYYKIRDRRIIKACQLMREVLLKNLERENKILKDLKH